MSLKDDWKKTGKDLGKSFAGLGKSIIKSVEAGADKVNGDEGKNESVEASDELVIAKGLELLDKKSTFTFIYFDDPDHIGHTIGWGTPEYQAKMTKIDEYVGRILAKLEENGMMKDTVVYFSSDHGGSDKGHGEARLDHMEAPFIIYGKGIKQGEITDSFANFDCASTVLAVLGVKQPQCWRGKPANVIEVK